MADVEGEEAVALHEHAECRICGGGAEESAPLFYPCKCSGTIRYIHQDCLTTWLAHSKKQSCDVCKHPYTFAKVYKPDMPKIIPPILFMQKLGKHIITSFIMGLRAWLVVFVWLILVPSCTIWVWRMYFWSGEQIAWAVYGPPSPAERHLHPHNTSNPLLDMVFLSNGSFNPHVYSNVTAALAAVNNLTDDEWSRVRIAVGADIFHGQIVTSMIVVLFLAGFLLREWIVQNAVPGVFGEGPDALRPAGVAAVPAPPLPQPPRVDDQPPRLDPINVPPPLPLPLPVQPTHPALPELAPVGQEEQQLKDAVRAVGRATERFNQQREAPGAQEAYIQELRSLRDEMQRNRAILDAQMELPVAVGPATIDQHEMADEEIEWDAAGPSASALPLKRGREAEAESRPNGVTFIPFEQSTGAGSSPAQEEENSLKHSSLPSSSRKRARSDPPSPSDDIISTFTAETARYQELQDMMEGSDDEGNRRHLDEPLFKPLEPSANPFSAVDVQDAQPIDIPVPVDNPALDLSRNTKKREVLKTLSDIQAEQNRQIREWRELYFKPTEGVAEGKRRLNDSGSLFSDWDNSSSMSGLSSSAFGTLSKEPSSSVPSISSLSPLASTHGQPSLLPPQTTLARPSLLSSAPTLTFAAGIGSPVDPPSRSSSQRSMRYGRHGKGKGKESWNKTAGVDQDTLTEWAAANSDNQGFQITPNFNFDFKPKSTSQAKSSPLSMGDSMEASSSQSMPSSFKFQPSLLPSQTTDPTLDPPQSSSTLIPTSLSRSVSATPLVARNIPSPSRRPPLPPTTPLAELPPPTPRPGHVVHIQTPLPSRPNEGGAIASPGLTVYRPPEELGVSANGGGYFEDMKFESEDTSPPDEREPELKQANGSADEPHNTWNADVLPFGDVGGPGPLLEDDDDDDDDIEDELLAQEVAPQPRGEPPVPLPAPVADPPDDEFEGAGEDDVEGAMEAIGMRGPIHLVFQNAALIMVLLDLTIAVGIWVPFTIGKTAFIVALRPRRGIRLVKLPLRVVRILTDPFVDLIIWLTRRVVLSATVSAISWMFGPAAVSDLRNALADMAKTITGVIPYSITTSSTIKVDVTPTNQTRVWKDVWAFIVDFIKSATPNTQVPSVDSSNITSTFLPSAILRSAQYVLPETSVLAIDTEVAVLANQSLHAVSSLKERFIEWWISRAKGTEPSDRLWAVIMGYTVATFALGIYISTLGNSGNVGAVGRTLRVVVKQQLIIIKVAIFIMIELVVFPLGCGIILDFNTLPIFPSGTLVARVLFYQRAPLTSLFYHWMLGTMFMYEFAILLAACRSIMRSGAMWFIKDPQDPNFHPIRDILERRALAQLRKLGTSALMYSIVIAVGIGSVMGTLRFLSFGIKNHPLLPLRLSMHQPISELPYDLLFAHVVIPPTLHYLRPKKFFRQWLEKWWRWTARQLRLSSYMFGERHPDEAWYMEDTRTLMERLRNPFPGGDRHLRLVPTRWIRAPNTDALTLPPDNPALVQVDQSGQAITEAGAANLARQNEISQSADRDPSEDFITVHVPPHFGYRVIAFLIAFWLLGAALVVTGVAVPVFIGRIMVHLLGKQPVHDAYTFTVGFYIMWITFLIARQVLHQSQRRVTPQRLALKVLTWFGRLLYLGITLGVIIPILISLVMEFYLVLPLRLWLSTHPSMPEIRILEIWIVGVVYAKIGLRILRYQPPGDLLRSVDAILAGGWARPNTWVATRDIIGPIGAGLLAMVLLPLLATVGLRHVFPSAINDLTAFYYVYPGIFVCAGALQILQSLLKVMMKWTQSIRDTEFLLEVKLLNLEKTPETPIQNQPETAAG